MKKKKDQVCFGAFCVHLCTTFTANVGYALNVTR